MTFRTVALAVALLAAPAVAQPAQEPPKLVVAISVDQFSSDLFAEYRPHFTGGLKRLSNGVAFPAGFQSHAATETCPGHSTILTGARPARNGIIANNWFDLGTAREDKRIYCAEDERVPGSTSSKYTPSSMHLKVPTLGEYLKRANPASRTVAVAGKDRAVLMMGGHRIDQGWWWGGSGFVGKGDPQPAAAVAAVNASITDALSRPRDALALPPVCESRSRAVRIGNGATVGTGRFARAAGDARAFRASPELDGATLALAAALREELRLGGGTATDVLAIGLSATDYVGHSVGTEGSEMCLQLHSLDRDLGDFFKRLDATGIDYVVVLTADHGGHDLPERHREHAAPDAARVDEALGPKAVGQEIGTRLALQGQVLFGDGPFGDIYIDRAITGAMRERVLNEAVSAYRAHPQVAAVFTASDLRAAPSPSGPPESWSLVQRARASFDPERAGDFVVLLKPRVTPIAEPGVGYVSTHGSAWDYDRRVPILFWRKGLVPFEQPLGVETVDIAPTLASLIGLNLPAGTFDGRCLDLDAGEGTTCR